MPTPIRAPLSICSTPAETSRRPTSAKIATLTYSETDYPESAYGDLAVDVSLFDAYTDEVCEDIKEALNVTLRTAPEYVCQVRSYPRPVTGTARARRQGRLTGINNQASKVPLPAGHPRKYGLNFRDPAEINLFEGLECRSKVFLPRTPCWWPERCRVRRWQDP